MIQLTPWLWLDKYTSATYLRKLLPKQKSCTFYDGALPLSNEKYHTHPIIASHAINGKRKQKQKNVPWSSQYWIFDRFFCCWRRAKLSAIDRRKPTTVSLNFSIIQKKELYFEYSEIWFDWYFSSTTSQCKEVLSWTGAQQMFIIKNHKVTTVITFEILI